MKSNDTETAKELKEQLEGCFDFLKEIDVYNGIREQLNIYFIANFINKELYWRYDYISNDEYLNNNVFLEEQIKKIVVNHTQFLINIIREDLDAINTIKSVINELLNDRYMNEIKLLKKEIF